MTKLLSFIKLTRPFNLFMVALAQYVSVVFLSQPDGGFWLAPLLDSRFFLLSASSVLSAAGGYVINDYYDLKIDAINKPQKVYVGRSVRRRHAMFLHLLLIGLSVLLGSLVSLTIGSINLGACLLLWLYSARLKQRPFIGNLTVSLLTALSVLMVLFYIGSFREAVAAFAFFAFFSNLIREVVKDMQDEEGDRRFGCRTLPVIWGIRKTKKFVYGLLTAFNVGVCAFAIYWGSLYLQLFALIVIGLSLFFARRLYAADRVRDYKRLSLYCKLMMLLGLGSALLV